MQRASAELEPWRFAAPDSSLLIHDVTEAPRVPTCGSDSLTFCLPSRTTHIDSSCCKPADAGENWLLLTEPGDSLEFFVVAAAPTRAYLSGWLRGPNLQLQESLPGLTASFLRRRFTRGGAYTLFVSLESETVAVGSPYELRIRDPLGIIAYGGAPTIELAGGPGDTIVIRPAGVSREASALRSFMVVPGTYRVISPRTRTLSACRHPCSDSVEVSLASTTQTVRVP